MRTWLLTAGAVLLLLPASRGQGVDKKDLNAATAIIAEYAALEREFTVLLQAATTAEMREDALSIKPDPSAYALRLLAVARRDPKSAVAGEALLWIMTTASQVPEAKAAIGLFIEHHAANAGLTPALIDRLSSDPHPQMHNFLTRVATDNPNPATKEAAAAINKLAVGAVAPDITAKDTDGKEFKLSEYRGKVVLLDFWGHWCPPCRAMYTRKRLLVQRLKDAPFALIGVNSDKDKDLIKKQNEVDEMPWRSFWNGPEGVSGPIAKDFRVRGWPTLYLIDHEGVIRHCWIGNPANDTLEREINALIAKARK